MKRTLHIMYNKDKIICETFLVRVESGESDPKSWQKDQWPFCILCLLRFQAANTLYIENPGGEKKFPL